MKEQTNQLSPEQSLALISGMIRQAQGNISYNSKYFLLWGWCIAIANLGMYGLMKFTTYRYPYIVWLLTIPAVIITIIYAVRESRESVTQTHLDRITASLWICLFFVIPPIVGFGYKINFQINPLILLLTAVPTFISGIILRFKPLLIGGICFWIFSILCFLVDGPTQSLLGAMAVITGYLIPGYMLKNLKA
ncbi:MAG TPA: hypothetical protein VIT44_01530 [Cyclobacteriaceae bacterium]